MPEQAGPPERSDPAIIRHLMPVVFVGYVIVSCALFVMQWPAPPGSEAPTFPLLLRMVRQGPDESSLALARHFLDFGIFLLTGIGLVAMVIAWRRGTRRPLMWMMATALLGIAYASGMALYNGPMVSICGFTLILFGGMVAWVASSLRAADEIETEHETESKADKATGPVEIRTNDHASTHSIA
jgi:hypothetical protein